MKNLALTVSAIALLLLNGCSDSNVTTEDVIQNCDNISGTYSGSYSDTSCTGNHASGTINNFTISDGCSSEIQGFILSANGRVTLLNDNSGDSFSVRADTPPGSTCGGLTGTCNKTGTDAYHCTYAWDQGGGGSIDVRR